jgi:hypothetical protein
MGAFGRFRPLVHIPLIFGGIVLMLLLAFIFGLFVMLLWNWLITEIFGLPEINYWQAWGLVILCHLLFKAGYHHEHDHKDDEEHYKWKRRFKGKVKQILKEDEPDEEVHEENKESP